MKHLTDKEIKIGVMRMRMAGLKPGCKTCRFILRTGQPWCSKVKIKEDGTWTACSLYAPGRLETAPNRYAAYELSGFVDAGRIFEAHEAVKALEEAERT